jgi:Spy/CpxP family protein refolding chaperone
MKTKFREMKKLNWKVVLIASLVAVVAIGDLYAQGGRRYGRGMRNMDDPSFEAGRANRMERMAERLDLTDAQMEEIKALRTSFLNETNKRRAEKQVKMAELRAMQVSGDVSEKALDNLISEISTLDQQLMKARIMHRQEVRNLLNDEQKAIFDARGPMGPGNRGGRGYGHRGNCGQFN